MSSWDACEAEDDCKGYTCIRLVFKTTEGKFVGKTYCKLHCVSAVKDIACRIVTGKQPF